MVALRGLCESDAEAVVALYQAAFGEERPIDAQTIVDWSHSTELKPEWLRVLEIDGKVVGYGDVWIDNDEAALEVAAPGCWDVFLQWGEDSARAAGVSRARAFFPVGHELEEIVAARGYRYWRSAYTMQIDFDSDAPAVPALAPGIELRPYDPGDADRVRAGLNEAFAGDPFFHEATPRHFREFFLDVRGFDPSLCLLAWDGAELAAFVFAFAGQVGNPGLGSIKSLGVRPQWRRRGLGAALVCSAFRELHERGSRSVTLGVDGGNETGAVRLYERVGMRVVGRGDNWVLQL